MAPPALQAAFCLFKQVPLKHVRIQHAQTDITDIMSLLDHTTQDGLIFLKIFYATILLNNLPPEYNSFAFTQTITVANSHMQHITATILMEMDLPVTRKILHARISAVQISEDPSSLINRTNVIRRGLPKSKSLEGPDPLSLEIV